MLDPRTSTNIRIKKNYMQTKFLKTSSGLVTTKYSEPFGKLFCEKNKERISQAETAVKTNKYSERYLVNLNKLQRLTDKQKPLLNRTLSNSVNHDEFTMTSPMFNQKSTSQSHRSHLMTVNLKQLPKLHPSATFNGSHNKVQSLREDISYFCSQVLNLSTKTEDYKITFNRTKSSMHNFCEQMERNLNNKISGLQKLFNEVKQQNKNRSNNLQRDCMVIKQKNIQLKEYLTQIQQKIQGIQNVLGITTAHHKHYI